MKQSHVISNPPSGLEPECDEIRKVKWRYPLSWPRCRKIFGSNIFREKAFIFSLALWACAPKIRIGDFLSPAPPKPPIQKNCQTPPLEGFWGFDTLQSKVSRP
eukprot:TRINITY_DN34805_c0_g1_i1.p2 TRINITY_DN34805_c0_g1~~TRINITY_DN34805_c0_g1_i1.p2  ORF type:complete len:103 (+),score=20.48 TRINITY_DN34805_c0_g1_i1:485-793(+)